MYNYLKCIHEAAKEALGEKKVNKGRKTIFWNQEIEKDRIGKSYFLNGLVQGMTKYNTSRHKLQ